MDDLISKAVAAFRNSPNRGDADIHRMLVADGLKPAVAARLVEFLPMAYCRLLFESSGVRFSVTFQRRFPDGQISEERLLSSEPVWNESLEFVRRELKSDVSSADLLAVAARSSEFDAINQLSNGGSDLGNVVLTPTLLMWPEGGPR
jgi:hypothetical protein